MYGDIEKSTNQFAGCVDVPRQTLTERLKQERSGLAMRLSELDAAIGALESNPQIQTIFDLVQKVARY